MSASAAGVVHRVWGGVHVFEHHGARRISHLIFTGVGVWWVLEPGPTCGRLSIPRTSCSGWVSTMREHDFRRFWFRSGSSGGTGINRFAGKAMTIFAVVAAGRSFAFTWSRGVCVLATLIPNQMGVVAESLSRRCCGSVCGFRRMRRCRCCSGTWAWCRIRYGHSCDRAVTKWRFLFVAGFCRWGGVV